MAEETLLVWDLVRTARLVERQLIAVFDGLDLTPTEFGVLAALEDGARPTQVELAQAVLVRPQSMHTLLGALIDRGLVARDGMPGSGRRTAIVITDPGRAALARARPAVEAGNQPGTLHLGAADGCALARLLALVRDGLERPVNNGPTAGPGSA